MGFGKNLREIRRNKGKSQKELADLLAVDYGYYSRLEGEKVSFTPSKDFINKIVEKLGCDESEKASLFLEADRIDDEMEQLAKEASRRPELKSLFSSAINLSDEEIGELKKRIQKIQKTKKK